MSSAGAVQGLMVNASVYVASFPVFDSQSRERARERERRTHTHRGGGWFLIPRHGKAGEGELQKKTSVERGRQRAGELH